MSMLRFIDSGLSPDDVRHLVDTFYDRIQRHPVMPARMGTTSDAG